MKKLRFILPFATAFAILSVIVSCSGGGRKNMNEPGGKREVMSGKTNIEKESPSEDTEPVSYVMRLSGETLTLYEISGEEEIPLTAVNIDPLYYPPDDIKELNKGIVAYSKEEAFGRLENFTN